MSKNTIQRSTILEIVRSTHNHPTADCIYDQVRKKLPRISLGTVYRNLNLLVQQGEIREVFVTGGPSRYDSYLNKHYHFRCERCNTLFDLNEPVCNLIEKRVAKSTGFKVKDHNIELTGLCLQCKKTV